MVPQLLGAPRVRGLVKIVAYARHVAEGSADAPHDDIVDQLEDADAKVKEWCGASWPRLLQHQQIV